MVCIGCAYFSLYFLKTSIERNNFCMIMYVRYLSLSIYFFQNNFYSKLWGNKTSHILRNFKNATFYVDCFLCWVDLMLFPIQYFILSRDKQQLTSKRILLRPFILTLPQRYSFSIKRISHPDIWVNMKTNSDSWWPDVLSIGKNTKCIGNYCL